jgi:acetolactate synthase-1/2/3 large subunit
VCPADEPWYAGTFLNGNLESPLLERSDLILTVGLDALDFFNAPWRYTAPVYALEPDGTNTQHFLPTRRQYVGAPGALMQVLASSLGDPASTWQPAEVAAYHADVARLLRLDDERLTIPTALADARATLPPETLLTVDAGFGKPLTSYLWPACGPNTYFTAHGLSTMGYAIPAANALKLAHPHRPVLAVMGDGSLLLRGTEIGVAAEQGVAPIYVAWVDASLSQIEIKQRRQGLRTVGARLAPACCEKIAAAFGGVGWDVATRADFRAALGEAVRADRPALVGARVDQSSRESWFGLLRG